MAQNWKPRYYDKNSASTISIAILFQLFFRFTFRASARQVQVTLGDYVVNSASETLPAYTFGVREIRVHPYFKFTPQADRYVGISRVVLADAEMKLPVVQVRRGCSTIRSSGSLHASHSADLFAREKRGLSRTVWMGCWMGSIAGW